MHSGSLYNSYNLEVIIKGKPAREYLADDSTYIEGRRGTEYSLRFTNSTPKRVLAVLSVDGLSILNGKQASVDSDGYIVGPYGSIEVPGWTIDNSKVGKFKFCPKGDRRDHTYVEELNNAGFDVDEANQGVIGVMIFEEKYIHLPNIYTTYTTNNLLPGVYYAPNPLWDQAPSYRYTTSHYNPNVTAMASYNSVKPSMGTGFGEDKSFATQQVTFVKGQVMWTGSIYYDTIVNLRKMGVIIAPKKPNAFPGKLGCFVPKSRV